MMARAGWIVKQFVGDDVQALSVEVEGRVGRPLGMHTGLKTRLVITDPRDWRDGTVGVRRDTVNAGARIPIRFLETVALAS